MTTSPQTYQAPSFGAFFVVQPIPVQARELSPQETSPILAQAFEETADLIMASDEGKTHVVFGAPEEDALGKPRADFPQVRSQSGQSKAGWKLRGCQGSDEQIDAALNFELQERVTTSEASLERGIKTVAHSQAPEISERSLSGAERPSACATFGQASQLRELLIGEHRLGNGGGLGQQDALAFDHKGDEAILRSDSKGLSDRLGQPDLAVFLDRRCDHRSMHLRTFDHEFTIGVTACQTDGCAGG